MEYGAYHAHGEIAKALGTPVPEHGESVSVRVTPTLGPGEGVAEIEGAFWRVAKPDDPIVNAPVLRKPKSSSHGKKRQPV